MGQSDVPGHALAREWELTVAEYGESACVQAAGELDIATAPHVDAVLNELAAPGQTVTLDLRALTFMDSSGINLLLKHVARARKHGVTLSIITPPPGVARVLDVAGVARLLPLVEPPPLARG